jgi:ATP-dependent DNA helicase MPH1
LSSNARPYRVDQPVEPPTHHALNQDALKTWVYPLNLGAIRDYQYSIVKNGLYHNTLVALPTGLGKTFIAATVMLNFYRWTQNAKIVFVAPTKPLVSQQVEACLNIAGIPRSQATLLTGETPPALRESVWETKRLFFMTPQTMMNDLSKGCADPKSIVLIVIDEAHRATGDYAYVKIVQFLRRFNKSFRVLALTATPGSSVEAVQSVIDSLGISYVEIRTEESIDIRQYVHSKNEEIVSLEPSDEMLRIRELFSKALKPFVDKLSAANVYWGRDPMGLTTYGLLKAREDWAKGPGQHVNQGLKWQTMAVFTMLQSLAHAIKLLEYHGIKPFYDNLADFRSETEDKGAKGSKNKQQLTKDKSFQAMMTMIEKWLKLDNFVGHPKISYLCETLLNHFMDAGSGSSTRAIVFCEYRGSAEELVRVLNKHKPLISAAVFVGQADSKRSEGMKQKEQIETIERFKTGGFNVLVATSIGEEGLDIGQVDLIICYDASSSPIRMLQRMGRTGRKRAGKVVLLLMKGKEEEKFAKAKDNYDQMQKMICDGARFSFRHDLSARIVPRSILPEVDKRLVEIPIENSQDKSLPEPKRSNTGGRKPAMKKKFNMPDGVITGFMKASDIGQPDGTARSKKTQPVAREELADIPALDSVCLGARETKELAEVYKHVPYQGADSAFIELPELGRFPQRSLRPYKHVKHSAATKRAVRLFKTMGKLKHETDEFAGARGSDSGDWRKVSVPAYADDTDVEVPEIMSASKRGQTTASVAKELTPFTFDEEESGGEEAANPVVSRKATRGGRKATTSTRGRKAAKPKSRLKVTGDHLEDVGDDLTRPSGMVPSSDGSDDGGDLDDFVVGDDEPFSSFPSIGSSPPSKSSSAEDKSPEPATKTSTFYEPMDFSMTQESLPDVNELLGSTKAKKAPRPPSPRRVSEDEEDGIVVVAPRKAPTELKRKPTPVVMSPEEDGVVDAVRKPVLNKRRRVIADSEDEDDD